MKTLKILLTTLLLCIVSVACVDSNHQKEFYQIPRSDVAGYEAFISKYPQSIYVKDARERIETAKEEQRIREEQERRNAEIHRLDAKYGINSLPNGSQPYSSWYGSNLYLDDYTPHSEIRVKAPTNSDVIAIVRYNNSNGRVAGHSYIRAGMSSTIYLYNGSRYQTFFYYGTGWYPEKEMTNVRGGFLHGVSYSKDDSPQYMENDILTYELTLQVNGNFQTSASSEGEIF